MYVCMHLCIYVRMYVCMHACMYACMFACLLACLFLCFCWAYYLPGIQLSCKVPLLPRPPLWGGLGVVCMYLRGLVGIGMYVCMYVGM